MSDILKDLDRLLGTPTPVGISEEREISIEEDPEDGLLIELEGDIGDSGSDEGTAGGESGNLPGSGGGGGGSGNDSGSSGWTPPGWLTSNFGTLQSFLTSPLTFLRGRLIPVFLGGFFGFVFDLANLLAQPFVAAQTGISTLGTSLLSLQQAIFAPVIMLVNSVYGWLTAATSGLGPLQPFVLAIVAIGASYATIVVSIRLVRAVADSIPIASGVETFLFG